MALYLSAMISLDELLAPLSGNPFQCRRESVHGGFGANFPVCDDPGKGSQTEASNLLLLRRSITMLLENQDGRASHESLVLGEAFRTGKHGGLRGAPMDGFTAILKASPSTERDHQTGMPRSSA